MNNSRIFFWLLVVAAVTVAQGQAPGTAAGTLTVNGKPIKLTHALALRTTDWTIGPNRKMVEVPVIKLILSDAAVEDVEDDFELGAEGKEGNLHGLLIEFTKKGEPMSGKIFGNAFEAGSSSLLMSQVTFEPKVLSDKTVSGKVLVEPWDLGDVKYDFTGTFSAPVTSGPKPTVEGSGAAETAPAKAVQEFLRALSPNNVAALKQILRKEFVEMLQKPEASEALMGMLNGYFPANEVKQLKIIRVFDFGNRAWVEGVTKRPSRSGGAPTDVTYRIRTVKVDGSWKVQPM